MPPETPDRLPPDPDDAGYDAPPSGSGQDRDSDDDPNAYPQTLPDGKPFPTAGLATERRVSWLTLVFGAIAAGIVALRHNWPWAEGLAIGAILGWLNFRWLRRGMDALVGTSLAQAGAPKPRVPLWTYFAAAFRYALIALAAYVIFKYLEVPLASMIAGMCALGAAAVAASVYELIQPTE